MKFKNEKWNKGLLILLLIFFLIVSWFFIEQINLPFSKWLEAFKENKIQGLVIYFLITILAIVAAPLATLPLTPLASNFWGWEPVFLFSILGWQIGAIINFWIAHKFGRSILKKLVDLKKADQLVKNLPKQELFFTIFLLRMIVPVDLLSYALGFAKISFQTYFWATFLGIIPFAIVLSYGGEVLDSWEIIPVIVFSLLLVLLVRKLLKKRL